MRVRRLGLAFLLLCVACSGEDGDVREPYPQCDSDSTKLSEIAGAYDGATVRVSPTGRVTVLTGITSPGTGNETAMAQIAADLLGVEIEKIRVVQAPVASQLQGRSSWLRVARLHGEARNLSASATLK